VELTTRLKLTNQANAYQGILGQIPNLTALCAVDDAPYPALGS